MTQRTDRVDELLRQEIGAIIAREIADPRIGFVTITDVETTPDLRHAKVWVSVIGTSEERDAALRALGRAMPFIRHTLGARLRIRRIPELHVQADETLERGTRVLRLLNELEAGADPEALGPDPESLPTPGPHAPRDEATPADDPRTRGAGPGARRPTGGGRRAGKQHEPSAGRRSARSPRRRQS